MDYDFRIRSRNPLHRLRFQSLCSMLFYSFVLHFSLWPFWINFRWYVIDIKKTRSLSVPFVHFCCCCFLFGWLVCQWISITPAPLVEKTIFLLLNRFCIFVKNKIRWAYMWGSISRFFCSVPLINVPIRLSIPYSLDNSLGNKW